MGRFRTKIRKSWFSDDFIVLKYSTNGIFWKSVKTCEQDILDRYWYIEERTAKLHDAESLIKEFNTLKKVKEYEANQIEYATRRNEEKRLAHKKYLQEKSTFYKKHKRVNY